MDDFEQSYLIESYLSRAPRLIPNPNLANFDYQQVYAAVMARLAEPLPNGEESPFSSQDPNTGHAAFVGANVYINSLVVHLLNLTPSASYVRFMRMLGAETDPAEYAIVRLEFTRSQEAIASQIFTEIPLGTTIQSSKDSELMVITTEYASVYGTEAVITVPARLNRVGAFPDLSLGEFNILPRTIAFIDGVRNTALIDPGRGEETLVDAMLRIRDGIRTGNLGRFATDGVFDPANPSFYGRCVTQRDFEYYASVSGADKVAYVPPYQDYFGPQIVLYPASCVSAVEPVLKELSLEGDHFRVRPAEIIPVDGTITVRVVPSLTDGQVRQLAAIAIAPKYDKTKPPIGQNIPIGINPPAGIWGDTNFESNLATVLENVDGIYAVPTMELKHAVTQQPLSQIDVQPWHLFEVQSSIVFNVIR